jgi:hypothetical protein
VAEVIPFPGVDIPKCKVCGFPLMRVNDKVEPTKCFCCRKNIPLPLSRPEKKDAK